MGWQQAPIDALVHDGVSDDGSLVYHRAQILAVLDDPSLGPRVGLYRHAGFFRSHEARVRIAQLWEQAAAKIRLPKVKPEAPEHRQRTVDRLTGVLDTGLLSAELTRLALHYRAKAYKDLDQGAAARAGMQQVAESGGRLAPKARRGLANLSRLAGDFPTALAAVPTLGWTGRHHRVLGDIHWSHANTDQAVTAFEAGRTEAEEHGAAGERAMIQVRLALALSFADPDRAGAELSLAYQLLESLDQRSNALLAQVVALIKDAGTDGIIDRARSLNTDITGAGLPFLHRFVELAVAFHHAVRAEDQELTAAISRLRGLTATGDFSYFTDIAHFMGGLPLPGPTTTQWIDSPDAVRARWQHLVQTRRTRTCR
ncbi:hypothetical protein ABTX85_30955 [Streptomyces sp. NPDC096097]|uniref:hypothetical protein n=1 Tax=Streptomyces sp. NPDC096097 TaxID=3155546 RepID=UPI0033244505